jgi:hypothetical protein
MAILFPCTISMSHHGDYDQKTLKWFCNRWIDKKQWLEIHGYSPILTNIESNEDDGVES